jgi:hypothetical protein
MIAAVRSTSSTRALVLPATISDRVFEKAFDPRLPLRWLREIEEIRFSWRVSSRSRVALGVKLQT